MLKLARDIVQLLQDHPLTGNLYKHMLNYVLASGESDNYDTFLNIIIDQSATEYKEATMTIAEQLRLEGEHRGYKKGGLEAKKAVARNMLTKGATSAYIKEVTGLSDQDIAQLVAAH